MARYRKYDVRISLDERVRRLTPMAESGTSLWYYILSMPESSMVPGLSRVGRAAIAEALKWSAEGFAKAFGELFAEGLAKADWDARVVWIPNVITYDPPANQNVVLGWATHWDEIPDCPLKAEAWERFHRFFQELAETKRLEKKADGDPEACLKAFLKACPNRSGKGSAYHSRNPLPNPRARAHVRMQEQDAGTGERQTESGPPDGGGPTVSLIALPEILLPVAEPPTPPPATAPWAVKARRPKGVAPRDLEAVVVRCLREMRQAATDPRRCTTAADAVVSLWRALGNPEIHAFGDELVLVARAAQMATDKIFARDIRAEGWPGGTDRTFHVGTLCRHERWDDRLRAAQAWAHASGRLNGDGVAVVKRERWIDPGAPLTWEPLAAPEPLFRVYLRCARRLFEAELPGEDLKRSTEKLEGLEGREGGPADLTAVVRLALDEAGTW